MAYLTDPRWCNQAELSKLVTTMGKVAYDPQASGDCLAGLDALGCYGRSTTLVPACAKRLVP